VDGVRATCTNCVIEEGAGWFAPAPEEPLGKLPRHWPLGLLALIVLGPMLLLGVAELMTHTQPIPFERGPVHFSLPAK
jgi:hypothetical protein